jgi:hypothetical protein
MSKDKLSSVGVIDLGRYDDPLFAKPRAGRKEFEWIFSAPETSEPRPWALGFSSENPPRFRTIKDRKRCAEEIMQVLQRYGIEAEVRRS